MSPRGALLRAVVPVCLLAAGCRPATPIHSADRPSVLATRPVLEPSSWTRSYTGTVRPRFETDHAFRVGGKVVQRLVNVGDRVEAGQALLALDETDYALSVRAAENEVGATAAIALQARKEEERAGRTHAGGAISATEYDQKRAAADSAREKLDQARRMLELAKNRLAYCILRAEADGIVTALSAEVGQVLSEGQAVVRVARQGHREAVVGIPEHRAGEIHTMKATASTWAHPDRSVPVALRELTPSADPATRTYLARFALPDEFPAELGMTVMIVLAPASGTEELSVPLTALAGSSTQAGVWVIDPQTGAVQLRPVSVHAFRTDRAVLAGGLRSDELIVRAGVQKLDAGLTVRVKGVVR